MPPPGAAHPTAAGLGQPHPYPAGAFQLVRRAVEVAGGEVLRPECGVNAHTRARSAGRARSTRQNAIRSPSRSLTVSIQLDGLANSTANDPANGST